MIGNCLMDNERFAKNCTIEGHKFYITNKKSQISISTYKVYKCEHCGYNAELTQLESVMSWYFIRMPTCNEFILRSLMK